MHDLKWPWQGQKCQHAFSIHPWDPNFPLFHSIMSCFWVTAQFVEKCTEWMTPKDLDMFKVKNTNMHATYTTKAQIYIRFALRWDIFEFWPNLRKMHWMTPNDFDRFKVNNTNMHSTNTPEAQISVRFALRRADFELRPNFWKSAPNHPKWHWHVPGEKYQHACYIHPQRPNFQSASLYNEPFLSCGLIFGENSCLV